MGQVLDKLSGRAYIDVATETADAYTQVTLRNILVQDAECHICKEDSHDHYICCSAGHGACWSCLMKVITEVQPLCPHCRRLFLPSLIPNYAFNEAIREARKRPPVLPPPPPIQLSVTVTASGSDHPASPRPKRPRDPEGEAAAKRRQVERLAAAASALAD